MNTSNTNNIWKSFPNPLLLLSFGGFSLLVLMNCGRDPVNTDKLTEIRVGITSTFLGEAAIFTAEHHGIFQKYGLDVHIKGNDSGKSSITDLFDGKVDLAHVAETPVIYALLDSTYYPKKVPGFQILTNLIYADEVQQIIARKDHGISGPEDIRGKKVAVYQGTQLEYFLDSFLLEYQIPEESITRVDARPTNMDSLISNGFVDVAVTWEPYATHIRDELGNNATVLPTRLTYSTLWMVTTLDSYAQEHPDILRAYLKALHEAHEYIKDNPEKTQLLLSEKTGVPVDAINQNWHKLDFELSLDGRMLVLLEDQSRWLARKKPWINYQVISDDIINYQPLTDLYPERVTIIR